MDSKVIVDTDKAPKALGPYSQAVGYGGLLFCSGQIPIDPETNEVIQGGVEAQTARVMANLAAVLDARGLDFTHALRTTIYLKNMTDYAKVNEMYGRFFDRNPPARVAVEVSRLPKDVLVEIDMIAAVPEPAPAPEPEPEVAAEAAAPEAAEDVEANSAAASPEEE
ncbi:endoribonuclease L-PSP [Bradymonas sediminis]|uniref:Reactive intermediate/imine deaminase n=1 Tax=Bradymonas sediminis TaxID=1548548 RepID=A0A2Z4FP23_9DELT|nr:RidA family protein [Bradymonas sediminis]AWV90506.1 reactive intermediate/imine deaminase [Bradymonas sediminis]TDP72101.1 endoribonuclease L-PSP [Bradymonas sediminis]